MENPFIVSDDKLKILLNAFSAWSEQDEKERKYAADGKEKARNLKKTLLNKDYLSKVSRDELVEEILKYSRTLEGPAYIQLGKPRVSAASDSVRRNLIYLIDSPDPPFEKAARILEGDYKIPIFAKAFWSPIFQAQYPEILPNWNNKTENFLKEVGVDIKTSKLSIKQRYRLLSRAFQHLQTLDSSQNFHTLNHLMHYGTVVPEGVKLIDKLIKGEPGKKPEQGDDLTRKIEKWRKKHVIENRIETRKEYEAKARNLLETKIGQFSENDLRKFFEFLNTDFWKGTVRHNRFGMAYTGNNLNALVDQLDETNKWILRIWNAPEHELKVVLDEFYAKKPIKNAGTAFPSLILYLRNPSNFNLCFKKMEQGLEKLTGFSTAGYSGDSYFNYNHEVNNFKDQYALQPQEIDIILCLDEVSDHTECPFSSKTFQLLGQLHENPTRDFYQEHKDEFKKYLEDPFQQLLNQVATELPVQVRELVETGKGIFARIIKNDFGKGGAWDYYWGAFYPKGGKRISDAQLFLWINRELIEFGFYIGEYGSDQRRRFVRNCRENQDGLVNILEDSLADETLRFGKREEFTGGGGDSKDVESNPTWREWLKKPDESGIHAAVFLDKREVLRSSSEQLKAQIARTFEQLFPLVLLATSDDPLPAISEYLDLFEKEVEQKPTYTLSQCTEETGFEEAMLSRWVRAIERKGQAILYGPPGTGKTYIAERLARHLIGGDDGFSEVVQFHPAYAYEDFVQGIRPQAREDGSLFYPVVPGRFLKFCGETRKRKGRCVLIIDEINRANLARVLGELMYLLEYRDRGIPLASGGEFRIPSNVRIIGTMNTADRSIALVDHALRRRFAFLALYPQYDVLRNFHSDSGFPVERLIGTLEALNRKIGDRHYEVGITFFLRKDVGQHLEDIWRMEVEPYLEEYFFDQRDTAREFSWDKVKDKMLP